MDSNTGNVALVEEEDVLISFGISKAVLVTNVQEIVRIDPLEVPERFVAINPQVNPVRSADPCNEIPIIDFYLLSKGNKEELAKLDLACKQWGFFQISFAADGKSWSGNRGDAGEEFFGLPLEEKKHVVIQSNDIQGYGQPYVFSEDQILDWCDALLLAVYPIQYRNPKFWPKKPEQFKEAVDAYSSELKRVGEELIGALSLLLGLEKDELFVLHKEIVQGFRLNYYPHCAMPDKVLGLTPHSDPATLAILMQQDNVTGLQILQGGEWVPVKPIPNVLVVNVGDAIEIWSNGKYRSIEHRAVTNESIARISYATFFFPRDDAEIEPFDQMPQSPGSVQMYKKVRYGDYLRQNFAKKLEGKKFIQTAKNES